MTRLAILSDIHGNLPALEAVIDDMAQYKPDHVIVAGDMINGAPFNAEVLEQVIRPGWTVIRGNHEVFATHYGTTNLSPVHRNSPVLRWLAESISEWYHTLAALPDTLLLDYRDGPLVRVYHGLPQSNKKAINPYTSENQVDEWLAPVVAPVYVAGHYHIGFERYANRWHILNPGPVGMSQDGIRKANYMLLDAARDRWVPTFRRVDYDFGRVEEAFERHHLFEKLGAVGYLMLEQLRVARPLVNAFDGWYRQTHGDNGNGINGLRIEMAQEFLASDAVWEHLGDGYQVNRDLMQS